MQLSQAMAGLAEGDQVAARVADPGFLADGPA